MHRRILGLTLALIGLAPSAAFATAIARCQFHLLDTKMQLAQMEMDTFDQLRSGHSQIPNPLRGLMIAVYEAELDFLPVTLNEAFTYVPTVSKTALKYIERAHEDGLLILWKDAEDVRVRVLRAGRELKDLVRAEIDSHLAQIFADAAQVTTAPAAELGPMPAVRSDALERLLLRKMWSDFDRAWQPRGKVEDVHLRHTYALLVHLYKSNLHGQLINTREMGRYMPTGNIVTQRRATAAAAQAGLIEFGPPLRGQSGPSVRITSQGIAYVELRIDFTIDRMNAVLLKASTED